MTNKSDSLISTGVNASRETASPPPAKVGGVSVSGPTSAKLLKAALYVDGFNLYHAIDALERPYLKWLNLWALGERIIDRNTERLVVVRYFSAKKLDEPDKVKRHQEYITAISHYGVQVHLGHFSTEPRDCRKCGHAWDAPKEKESDVALGIQIIDDAYQDLFEVAYLVTADSDYGATARLFRKRFPAKKLIAVTPPGMDHCKAILTYTPHKLKLPEDFLEDCLLPPLCIEPIGGKPTLKFKRPGEYATPNGWVAPKDRPKKKATTATS